jgi:hypothetical protein
VTSSLSENPFGSGQILVEMLEPYWLSWVVGTAVLAWACVPLRGVPISKRAARGGADTTYFVAVFFWAIEIIVRAHDSVGWGHNSDEPTMPWKLQAVFSSAATLTVLMVMAFLSECVAAGRGHGVRAAGLSVPVPTVAAIAAGFGSWFLVMGLFAWW